MGCARPNTPRSNPKDIGELAEPLRSRIYTAVQDAPTGGLVLVSGYRDPGRQWDLRHDRCAGRECDPRCKGYPVTALPATWNGSEWVGGSKHQHRKAADMGGRELDWLIANRAAYGLGLTVRSENWHFEAEGTDSRTGRAIPAPTKRIIPFPSTAATPKPTVPVVRSTLRQGDKGDDVRFMQAMLNIVTPELRRQGFGDGKPLAEDGIFGARTGARVNEFERYWNKKGPGRQKPLMQDHIFTEGTAAALAAIVTLVMAG